MLYIFLVNNGTMINFDVNMAMDTVENLKSAIYEKYQIPTIDQVFLISGGKCLSNRDRVCEYSSAGTDTSPIFLFCKNQVLSTKLEVSSTDDMRERVESCLQMQPNFNTVVSRNEMARQLYETDRTIFNECHNLVHDQHLQQQGWATVMANLEDFVASFEIKASKVESMYSELLRDKFQFYQLLEGLENDEKILEKIPILNCLSSKTENYENQSLLDWIIGKMNESSIKQLYCFEELNMFDDEKLINLKKSIKEVLDNCSQSKMKEIKGLVQRLSVLERYIDEAKKIFEKQGILAQGFDQNQNRLSDVPDPSILPDLCQNHKEQLQMMLKNHMDLIDLKTKFLNAKRELSSNLNQRIKWVIHIEEQLKYQDELLVVIGIKLQKIRINQQLIKNLHITPKVYFDSIVEVLRRKNFTDTFYSWAKTVSEIANQLIKNEIDCRNSFSVQVGNHFIRTFFPGMNDLPENFTTDLVYIDQSLPQIKFSDIDLLKQKLPENLSESFVTPSFVPLPTGLAENNFLNFCQKKDSCMSTSLSLNDINSLESKNNDIEKFVNEKDEIIENLKENIKVSNSNCTSQTNLLNNFKQVTFGSLNSLSIIFEELNSQLKQSTGSCIKEFETLNSELLSLQKKLIHFENISVQKINKFNEKINYLEGLLERKDTALCHLNQELWEETEKNLRNSTTITEMSHQIDSLNSELKKKNLASENLNLQLLNLNSKFIEFKKEIQEHLDRYQNEALNFFTEQWKQFAIEAQQNHKQEIVRMQHEIITEKDSEIQKLRDQLSLDHKNELESLRHRFKLAISTTSIERTSSETSLEKVQLDIVDQSAQEKEIQKLKSMLNDQKLEFDQKLTAEKNNYENSLQTLKADFENEKKLLITNFKKLLSENEMNTEFFSQKLTLYETLVPLLNFKITVDTNDPKKCQETICSLQQDLKDFNRNVDLFNCRSFISISSIPEYAINDNDLTNFDLSNVDWNINEKITFTSCQIGDTVLVYFEPVLKNLYVFSISPDLYIVHSDSWKECDISKDFYPKEMICIVAKVTDVDYCQIKKQENSYKLPLNKKFYRVKIKKISQCTPNSSRLKQLEQINHLIPSTSPSRNVFSYFSNLTSSSSMMNSPEEASSSHSVAQPSTSSTN